MRSLLIPALAVFFATAGLSTPAFAKAWGVDPERSSISFSGTHAGNNFEGVFEDWTANIEFDPAAPESAVVLVTIDTASAKTGNALYDGTLGGADWFNVQTYPQARFEATGAEPQGDGTYKLAGTLTVRGTSVPVSVMFSANDSEAKADSTVVLQRLDFGMGAESDPSGTWVSLEIPVTVELVAKPSGI
ncbi:MAG: YceI family protein [Pseudomonadota bacterium]